MSVYDRPIARPETTGIGSVRGSSRPVDPFPRKGRDLRLAFFRGLSLFFIFISGYTAALVYGRTMRHQGLVFAGAQVWRRVWQLYVAHIFLFVIFTAEVSYTVLAVNNPMYNEEMGVGDFLSEPHVAIIKALLLQFQPTFLDILPLYIVLLGIFPLVLIALARAPLWALIPSAVLYALTLRHGWALPAYPADRVWYFNPLAWQLLFIIGASAGYARVNGRWPFPHAPWLSQLAVIVAAVLVVINVSWAIHWVYDPFPALFEKLLYNFTIDKTNLAPFRLLNFLALALATVHFVRPESGFLRWRAMQPIIRCGQHSL